jgi:hypothetical protein
VITSAEDGGPPFAIHDGPDTVELQGSCLTLQDAVRWCVEEYRKRHPGRLITLVREPGCVSSEVIYGLDDCRRGFVPPDALQLELPFPSVPTTDPHESV